MLRYIVHRHAHYVQVAYCSLMGYTVTLLHDVVVVLGLNGLRTGPSCVKGLVSGSDTRSCPLERCRSVCVPFARRCEIDKP